MSDVSPIDDVRVLAALLERTLLLLISYMGTHGDVGALEYEVREMLEYVDENYPS